MRSEPVVADTGIKLGVVEAVNVGPVIAIEWHGRLVTTAIWTRPVAGRVAGHGVNIASDDHADRTGHGGFDKAVYAYTSEDTDWWAERLTGRLESGAFGENLTERGLDVTGAYLRILQAGTVAAGDTVEVVYRPGHRLSVGDAVYAYHIDHGQAARLREAPGLSESWRRWAGRRQAGHRRHPSKPAGEDGGCHPERASTNAGANSHDQEGDGASMEHRPSTNQMTKPFAVSDGTFDHQVPGLIAIPSLPLWWARLRGAPMRIFLGRSSRCGRPGVGEPLMGAQSNPARRKRG
jgi:MOSC domain-containing protein YiiM